jgi:DNA-binding SARP family transcriptional activator/tetratricopeptide (TPR) repeat protein
MRFQVLGPLEVQVNGSWNGINAPKWRTVLAVLLLQSGQVVSTDRLITEVWADQPPDRATNLISVYVHRLRRRIGDPAGQVLVTHSPGYQLLATPDDIDALRFARLVAAGRKELAGGTPDQAAALLSGALGLWRGTRALADVPGSPLVSAEASRLEEARVEAIELRIQADLGCGRQAEVVGELRRLLADHPLREGMWALLMRALLRSGRQAEALEAYAQARDVIAGELGVDPGAELRQLYEQMLRADAGTGGSTSLTPPAPDSPFAAPPPRAPAGVAPPAAPAPSAATTAPGRPGAPPAPPGAGPADTSAVGMTAAGAGAAGAGAAGASGPAGGPAAAGQLPPVAQLPADIPDFTGRAEHVHALHDLLSSPERPDSPGAVVVAAVIGAGGLGKTTLAVHAAHRLRAQFPDGQLYANLHGALPTAASPSDVLARFLRDLGADPARIPADEEERAAQYRSRLTDRKVLIVLDDAPDAAHVRPLLPGSSSCAVLVTTRNRMPDLAGSRFVDLDVLDATEARDMFAGIIGRGRAQAEPEATDEVLAACAGLPLAIRIAGARLAARGSWSVRNLARRLSDERRRLDELKTGDLAVRACFEVSFASLPSRVQDEGVDPAQAFRLLGIWHGPSIGLPAAAALLGQPEDNVADALEVLVDAQLLQAPAPDRYRFHDLLRAYAAERALAEESAPDRAAATARVLNWYLYSVAAMARVLSPHREPVPLEPAGDGWKPLSFSAVDEALDWCELERGNLVAAAEQAAASGLDEIAWKLPVAALSYFNRRSYRTEWLTTHQIALASAQRLGDRSAEAWVLNNLGMVHGQLGLGDAMVGYFAQAMAMRRESGDELHAAQVANNLADACLRLGRFEEAIVALHEALAIFRRIGHQYGEAVALINLGEACLGQSRVDEAIGYLQQARALFSAVDDARGEGYALYHLGQAFRERGRVGEALDCLRQALRIRRAVGERGAEALTLQQLGQAELAAGRPAEARECWSAALALFEALDDQVRAAEVRAGLARLADGPRAQPG